MPENTTTSLTPKPSSTTKTQESVHEEDRRQELDMTQELVTHDYSSNPKGTSLILHIFLKPKHLEQLLYLSSF